MQEKSKKTSKNRKFLRTSLYIRLKEVKNARRNETINYILIYGFAVLVPFLVIVIKLLFSPFIGTASPFLLFLAAIALSLWGGGYIAGIITTVLSAGAIVYFFVPPYNAFAISQPTSLIQVSLFLLEGIFISYIIERSKRNDLVKEYKKKEKEYIELINTLRTENEKAQQEIRMRDEFLSIVSHELKTPLSSMLLQVQVMLHSIRNVSLANFSVQNLMKMLEGAEQQSKRLAKMINDLLNVSLMTSGRLELEPEEIDLTQIVKETVSRFAEKFKKEGYKIRLKADQPIKGTWDKLRMEQVLTNLISNALKYGDKKPIEIKATRHNSTAKIDIIDHGIGIPADQQGKIFTRFERAVSPKDYKGLGVGLYITQQIVKAHGGKIKVDSSPNNGSHFTIELPIRK